MQTGENFHSVELQKMGACRGCFKFMSCCVIGSIKSNCLQFFETIWWTEQCSNTGWWFIRLWMKRIWWWNTMVYNSKVRCYLCNTEGELARQGTQFTEFPGSSTENDHHASMQSRAKAWASDDWRWSLPHWLPTTLSQRQGNLGLTFHSWTCKHLYVRHRRQVTFL